ncbi:MULTISPECIES: hypothetical protein [unclassified Dietzia]|uniref:hypothetical protein n=1 Tax=unclassified Dietzia TaxID=2617939 RepID=UPI0015FE31C9|nr:MULTISPECIES: hypothetical protein [unclassified Dietzia]MBB1022987.1 hypothetical protein [Dietzia sp. DQ12-76]MBB1028779.1 hypothetical protein [Dietzia sp. DQ11-38-2]
MSDASELRRDLDEAQDRFEQYRASVTTMFDERAAGELSRALEVVLPDLAFYEGQAVAAAVALEYLAVDPSCVPKVLADELVEQQAARRSREFLAGVATVLARVNQHVPR